MSDEKKVYTIGSILPSGFPKPPKYKPVYRMKCIIILGTEVRATKHHFIDDEGSYIPEGHKGVVKEVRITENKESYGIRFEEIHWVLKDMGGAHTRVEGFTLYFTPEQMKEAGIKIIEVEEE